MSLTGRNGRGPEVVPPEAFDRDQKDRQTIGRIGLLIVVVIVALIILKATLT